MLHGSVLKQVSRQNIWDEVHFSLTLTTIQNWNNRNKIELRRDCWSLNSFCLLCNFSSNPSPAIALPCHFLTAWCFWILLTLSNNFRSWLSLRKSMLVPNRRLLVEVVNMNLSQLQHGLVKVFTWIWQRGKMLKTSSLSTNRFTWIPSHTHLCTFAANVAAA